MLNQFFVEEESKRISKWISVSLAIFSIFLLVKILLDIKRFPNVGREIYPQSTIVVSGEGEAYAIPNIASFSFSVTEVGESVESAQGLLDAKIRDSLAILKEAEIEDKDIKTIGYNVHPKYEWQEIYCINYPCPRGRNKLIGYEVSQSISVKVREINKAGDLVNKIGAINVSNISGVEFTVDNLDLYISKAREEAIKKAKEQAKSTAKQLGVRLGRIIYFNESGNYLPPPFPYEDIKMGKDIALQSAPMRAELPQGETRIKSEVNITYEIR